MTVYVNGTSYGTQYVNSSSQDYTFSVNIPASDPVSVDVLYDNDHDYGHLLAFLFGNTGDRNLFINSVQVGDKTILPTDSGVTVDTGSGYSAATDGINVSTYGTGMYLDSALRMSTTLSEVFAPASLIAEYSFEESTAWSGTNNELKDSAGYSGGPFDGQGGGSPLPTQKNSAPAIAGATGTCEYAEFDERNGGSTFSIDNVPVDTSANAKTSVSFWMYWDGTNSVMPIGWNRHDLWLVSGVFGFNTWSSDVYGINSAGLANGWHHVVAVFNNGNVTANKLYIDGTLQSLSQQYGSPNNTRSYVQSTLMIGGVENSSSYRFNGGYIDEVKVYRGEIDQTQVTADYTATHACDLTNVNLALNKPASQSSTDWGGVVSRANDGNRNGYWSGGSISHTSTEAQPWWQVDLQGEYRLSKISIFKRLDSCCINRLRDFYVFVSKTDLTGRTLSDIVSDTSVSRTYYSGIAPNQLDLTDQGVGRYIRIQMTDSNVTLELAELEAYGTVYSPPELIAEYHLDETEWDGTSGEAVDTAGYTGGPFSGTAIGSPFPNANHIDRARSGATGTCGYAELNGPVNGGGAFSFTGIPFDTADGDVNTVSFWLYFDGSSGVIPISSNGYGLLINNNKFGFTSDGTNIYGVDITGTPNGWYHIVAVFNQGDISQNKLYIDSGLQTLSLQAGSLREEKAFFDAGDYSVPTGTHTYIVPTSPWFTDNNGGDLEFAKSNYYGVSGTVRNVIELEAQQSPADISNIKATIATTPGDTVFVSFDHAERNGYPNSDFEVYIDNTVVARVDNNTNNFVHYEYSGITSSTSTLIELKATDMNGYGVILDNIKIETQSAASLTNTIQAGGTTENTNYRFTGRLDEIKFYRGEIDQTQVTADYNATHACPNYVTNQDASGFNCIAEQETDLDSGHLYMQLAGQAFNIKVVALKSDGTAETEFSALSDKSISLAFIDQTNSNTPITFNDGANKTSKTITFTTANNTGIETVSGLSISSAYKNLKCQITDANQSPALTALSSDNFSVRPVAFTISSDANSDSAGTNEHAGQTIIAGENFTLTAETSTPGYSAEPALDSGQIEAHDGAYQAGSITGSFGNANPSDGAASNTFTYSEVGYFRIRSFGVYDNSFTQEDIADGDCTTDYSNNASGGKYGCYFANRTHSDYFGRFVPKYFNVDDSSVSFSGVCDTTSLTSNTGSTLTYYGQAGLTSTFIIRAVNASGGRTRNYQMAANNHDYGKLDVNNWTGTGSSYGLRFSATNLPTYASLDAANSSITTSTGWAEGQATITAVHTISASNPTTEVDINMQVDPIDADNVIVINGNPETISKPHQTLRYGRLAMQNAYGSELQGLSVPIETQYWDGETYRTNKLDDLNSCTTLSTGSIVLSNYTQNLSVGETSVDAINITAGTTGQANIYLRAPGVGNNGSVNLDYDLTGMSWFGTPPTAKATFGLNKTPIIYFRENF